MIRGSSCQHLGYVVRRFAAVVISVAIYLSRDHLAVAELARLPHRLPDEQGIARGSPGPVTSPPDEQVRSGYKLLLTSYWSGAAWRWR